MKKLILIPILMLFILSVVQASIYSGNLPADYISNNKPLSFFSIFKPLTIVNGGLCDTSPDATGMFSTYRYVHCTDNDGTYNSISGCAVNFYDGSWKTIGSYSELNAGAKVLAPTNAVYWERYNCRATEGYTCTDYEDAGCGASNCADNEMLRERTCSGNVPSGEKLSTCIWQTECKVQTCFLTHSEWGDCIDGARYRTMVDPDQDCRTETQKQACNGNLVVPDNPIEPSKPSFDFMAVGIALLLIGGLYFGYKKVIK